MGGPVAPTQKFIWLGCLDVEGSDDIRMERWGSAQEVGVESPVLQQFEHCLCESCDVHEKQILVLNNHLHYSVVFKLQILQF